MAFISNLPTHSTFVANRTPSVAPSASKPTAQASQSTALPTETMVFLSQVPDAVDAVPQTPAKVSARTEVEKPQAQTAYTAPTVLSADDFSAFPTLSEGENKTSAKTGDVPNFSAPLAILEEMAEHAWSAMTNSVTSKRESTAGKIMPDFISDAPAHISSTGMATARVSSSLTERLLQNPELNSQELKLAMLADSTKIHSSTGIATARTSSHATELLSASPDLDNSTLKALLKGQRI